MHAPKDANASKGLVAQSRAGFPLHSLTDRHELFQGNAVKRIRAVWR